MNRVCGTFYAVNTGQKSEGGFPLFECAKGPEKKFDSYVREVGESEF